MGHDPEFRPGQQSYLFAVFGGLLMASSMLFVVIALVTTQPDLPPTGASVLEGTVEPGPLVEGAFGQRVLYAHVEIRAVTGSGRGRRYAQLYQGSIGSPRLRLRTAHGVESIEIPPYAYGRWKHPVWAFDSRASLEGTGLSAYVKGWQQVQRDYFYVASIGVRPGQELLVDRSNPSSPTVWFGARASIVAREKANQAFGLRLWGLAGGMLGLLGAGLLWLHCVMRRRIRRATPPDHGESSLPAWVAVVATQRGGWYRGTLGGRPLEVRSEYRRHGMGPLVLRVSTSLATRLSLVRRGGSGAGAGLLPPRAPTPLTLTELPDVEVQREDLPWLAAALEHPDVRRYISWVFDPATTPSDSVGLLLTPGTVEIVLTGQRHHEVTPRMAARWLEALSGFAGALEMLAPP